MRIGSLLPVGQRFRFEVRLTRQEAREAARSIMDKNPGKVDEIWGLAVGRLIFMQAGLVASPPALFAWLKEREGNLVVSGAAGINLLGLLGLALFNALAIGAALAAGLAKGEWKGLAIVSFFPVLLYAVAWTNQPFRRDADLLVRRLKQALGAEARQPRPRRSALFPERTGVPMQLDICGERQLDPAAPDEVGAALLRIAEEEAGFIILSIDSDHYMQTAWDHDGFTLEKREGSEAQHFVAIRTADPPARPRTGSTLSLDEVAAAFAAYCAQTDTPPGIAWTPLYV